jgi:hypothetical protein
MSILLLTNLLTTQHLATDKVVMLMIPEIASPKRVCKEK